MSCKAPCLAPLSHLRLVQKRTPSRKGSCCQPTNTTPVSPGAQKACERDHRASMNKGQWLRQGAQPQEYVGGVSANLSRGYTLRDSLKHRDVAALDIQHAEHRSAFGNHVFSPVFIKHKLIPLRTQDTQYPILLEPALSPGSQCLPSSDRHSVGKEHTVPQGCPAGPSGPGHDPEHLDGLV